VAPGGRDPGSLDARTERELASRVAGIDAVFIVNRSMPEFGVRRFGEGYCETLMNAISKQMHLAGILGAPVKERPDLLRGNQALYFVKAPPGRGGGQGGNPVPGPPQQDSIP
jgi:hypothetical protein